MTKQTARTLADFRSGGRHFMTKAVETHTKAHGHHVRLEHRLDGRIVTQEAWLTASKNADPEAHARAYGSDEEGDGHFESRHDLDEDDETAERCAKDCPAEPSGKCVICDDDGTGPPEHGPY